jgi:hypothetical protein
MNRREILRALSLTCMALALCLCAGSEGLFAAGSTGTSGAAFLELGVGSRPLGMGEAFTAAVGDINSIYYNPAGLGTMKYPEISVMHQDLILDSRFENFSLAWPLWKGFLGVSNSLFWVPSFERVDINGDNQGQIQFYNTATTVAYGQSLGFVEVGASFKHIYEKIGPLTVNAAAFDVGILKRLYMYSPFDAPIRNLSLGLSLQNMGTKAKNDPLPRTLRVGSSYYLTKWFGLNIDISEYFIDSSDLYDFTYGFDESLRVMTGFELNYLDLLSFRAGYRFIDTNLGDFTGKYSMGFGFNYAIKNVAFQIDTSYTDTRVFGPVYSFTISFKLIPRVITVESKIKAEEYYQKGIRYYIQNDLEAAIEAFRDCAENNPYHKNVKQKILELEELRELQLENEKIEKERKKGR